MRHTSFTVLQIVALLSTLVFFMVFSVQRTTFVQASPGTVVKVEPSTSYSDIGETFTINITVADVQNLYGIEVILYWNASVLHAMSVDTRLGVESHPDGVLHEPPSIFVAENNVTQKQGKYVLTATSVAPAPSFSGSGNIVRITFNVTSFADSELNLETKLYDYPPPDREPPISLPIEHITIDGSFRIIPEFPNLSFLLLLMAISLCAIILLKRRQQRRRLKNIRIVHTRIKSISARQGLLDARVGST